MPRLVEQGELRRKRAAAQKEQRVQKLMKARNLSHADALRVVNAFEGAKALAYAASAAKVFGLSDSKSIKETERLAVKKIMDEPIVRDTLEALRKTDQTVDLALRLIEQLYTK